MRFPVKAKSDKIPAFLRKIVPVKPDPLPLIEEILDAAAFSRCISSICLDGIWKTTRPSRHLQTNRMLAEELSANNPLTVLDTAVSDGVTSSELLDTLGSRVKTFLATDLYFSVRAAYWGGIWYFYPKDRNHCFMAAGKRLIYYLPGNDAVVPFGWWASRRLAAAPQPVETTDVRLLNPKVLAGAAADPRLQFRAWNIFRPWDFDPVDLVRAANVLNPVYFSADRIQIAVRNLANALIDGGHLVVVDNRSAEKATLFRKSGTSLVVVRRLGPGCDAESDCLSAVLA